MHLHLSRDPGIAVAGGPVQPLALRDGGLLAWLALEGPTSRAKLASLFWPEAAVDAARNALRQRLFQIKRQIGQDVVAGTSVLALAEGVTHDLADSDSVLGEANPGFGPELNAWLTQQRAGRHARVRESLAERCEMALQAHDHAAALSRAACSRSNPCLKSPIAA